MKIFIFFIIPFVSHIILYIISLRKLNKWARDWIEIVPILITHRTEIFTTFEDIITKDAYYLSFAFHMKLELHNCIIHLKVSSGTRISINSMHKL